RRPNLTRAGSDADELHERADARGPEKHQRGEFREEAETDCYAEGDRQAPPRAAVRSEKFYLEKDPHQREEAREGLGVDHGVRVEAGITAWRSSALAVVILAVRFWTIGAGAR